jgi:hypothetical protein
MKIVFHENCLSERGTSTALFDYAYWCRELLNIDPIVCFDLNYNFNSDSLSKFVKEFKVEGYADQSHLQRIVDKEKPDYFYAIKYGTRDHVTVLNSKNLIHSVFNFDPSHIHGNVYAVVSEWQHIKSNYSIPFVPHMLNLPTVQEDFREYLGIPQNAVVVGRYGAKETFNVDFVPDTILKVLNNRKDIWFLFMNTEPRINHSRCIYFNPTVDLSHKVKFINTCDAMLHARDYGETFGLSVLEFAAQGKQIISYDNEELQTQHPLGGRNHFLFLKDNCFKYGTANQVGYILSYLTRKNPFNTDYLIKDFSPSNVIDQFQRVFLS